MNSCLSEKFTVTPEHKRPLLGIDHPPLQAPPPLYKEGKSCGPPPPHTIPPHPPPPFIPSYIQSHSLQSLDPPPNNTTSPRTLRELWEAKPLLIKRHNTKYNVGWFSSEEFSNIIRDVGNTTVKVACSS